MQTVPAPGDGGEQPSLEEVNQRLEEAIAQLRIASEALQASHRDLNYFSQQLEMMHEEVDGLQREILQLKAGTLLESAAS